MSPRKIRIGFIGAGSVGSLFGGCLAAIQSDLYSIEVFLFCRKAHAEAINKNGLTIYEAGDVQVIKNIQCYENTEDIEAKMSRDSSYSFDFLFLTTKTYSMKSALSQYNKVINVSRNLVILQNGVGNEDIAEEYCPSSKIIRAVTVIGALLEKPGHVFHTGTGLTKIGFPFLNFQKISSTKTQNYLDLRLLSELLNLAGLETTIVEDIIKECWEKIFINIGINAFGALTRLRNGELLEIDGLMHLMGEAINEAIIVAELKNISLSKKNYAALAYNVAKNTYENKNSMLQDILNGKNTEIDFINGRIVKYARELSIEVPINETLTCLIKGLEKSVD